MALATIRCLPKLQHEAVPAEAWVDDSGVVASLLSIVVVPAVVVVVVVEGGGGEVLEGLGEGLLFPW